MVAFTSTSNTSAEGDDNMTTDAPSISVIIPTKNEGILLPRLLGSLRSQPNITEIIVADNGSRDDTVRIAQAAGCILARGGLPSTGKNMGARLASGDVLLFADADTIIEPTHLQCIETLFKDPKYSLLFFRQMPLTKSSFVRCAYTMAHLYACLCAALGRPQGGAPVIAIRRDVFAQAGGFDEHVMAAEDVELIRRIGQTTGSVLYASDVKLYVSARRFRVECGVIYGLKCIAWAVMRAVGLRISLRKYRWIDYPERVLSGEAAWSSEVRAGTVHSDRGAV
jgi:hypothetical protein